MQLTILYWKDQHELICRQTAARPSGVLYTLAPALDIIELYGLQPTTSLRSITVTHIDLARILIALQATGRRFTLFYAIPTTQIPRHLPIVSSWVAVVSHQVDHVLWVKATAEGHTALAATLFDEWDLQDPSLLPLLLQGPVVMPWTKGIEPMVPASKFASYEQLGHLQRRRIRQLEHELAQSRNLLYEARVSPPTYSYDSYSLNFRELRRLLPTTSTLKVDEACRGRIEGPVPTLIACASVVNHRRRRLAAPQVQLPEPQDDPISRLHYLAAQRLLDQNADDLLGEATAALEHARRVDCKWDQLQRAIQLAVRVDVSLKVRDAIKAKRTGDPDPRSILNRFHIPIHPIDDILLVAVEEDLSPHTWLYGDDDTLQRIFEWLQTRIGDPPIVRIHRSSLAVGCSLDDLKET